jgi:hypothetical protein
MTIRKYHPNTAAEDRVAFGIELEAGLRYFPETAALADALGVQNQELDRLVADLERVSRLLLPLRAAVKFTNYAYDSVIRGCSKTAEVADGGKRGRIHEAIFAEGTTPVITPSGAAQLPKARKHAQSFEASKAPGVDAVRAEWLPKIQAAITKHAEAVAARDAGYAEVAKAMAARDAAADDHELAVERIQGHVRAVFPKDRARWGVIFPTARGASAVAPEEPEAPITPSGA